MRKFPGWFSHIRSGFLLFLLTVFCIVSCGKPSQVSGEVLLYTSVPWDVITEIELAFENQYQGVDLLVYRAGTGEVMARVDEELAAGQVKADLLWVADFTVGEELKNQRVLLQYTPPEADALLGNLQDKDGTYFAARLLNMVVAFNTEAVLTQPTGYEDLLNEQYYGRVGHASPETSGAFLYFMGALFQNPDYGEDFFQLLAANEPAIQSNTKTTEQIAIGELDIGITIDFTVRSYLQDNPGAPIDYVYPEAGVVMVPSPIIIFKNASNVEAAKAFEGYILSQAGQTLLRDFAGVVPVRLDVAPPAGIESIAQLQVIPVDPYWISTHRAEILATFTALYGDQ